jgi:hypothetical protein
MPADSTRNFEAFHAALAHIRPHLFQMYAALARIQELEKRRARPD